MDFRLTTKTIREQFKGGRDDELGVYRYKTKRLGRVSWHLFWLELGSLIVGLIGLVGTIVVKYGIKLF